LITLPLLLLLNSSTECERLILKKYKTKTFSWDKIAQTADVYRSLSDIGLT
jgi:hypothetical protein